MRTMKIRSSLVRDAFVGAATLMSGAEAKSDSTTTIGGAVAVYGNTPAGSDRVPLHARSASSA